jgi:hypothetical protein
MIKRSRRSPEHWLALIEQQATSNLSIATFCQQQGIGSASFYKWKQYWLDKTDIAKPEAASGFIDLTKLNDEPTSAWNIVLRLGNGMELQLTSQ